MDSRHTRNSLSWDHTAYEDAHKSCIKEVKYCELLQFIAYISFQQVNDVFSVTPRTLVFPVNHSL